MSRDHANTLIREAIEKYGLDGRAYEYDRRARGVIVWAVKYDDGWPVSMRKISTWIGNTGKPPVAQLSFKF